MDISQVIKEGIASLPDGDHQRSLAAVSNHIDVAISHLNQGQATNQTHLFTDAIYRCNQAYEGSIKEAYKVLTGKDPTKRTTSQIENHLQRNNVLRPRVLAQLKRYRQEWRNPATHDHTEDFDESEAFLAIVNIVAFAKVCIDQINQKFAFERVQGASPPLKIPETAHRADSAETAGLFAEQFFDETAKKLDWSHPNPPESEIVASFAGFLSNIPDATVHAERGVGEPPRYHVDIYFELEASHTFIELKSAKTTNSLNLGLIAIDRYLFVDEEANGLLILYDFEAPSYKTYDLGPSPSGRRRILVAPSSEFLTGLFKELS